MRARSSSWRGARSTLALAAALLAAAPAAGALEVRQRARIGDNAEGLTYVVRGPQAHHAVVLDGYQLRAVPAAGQGRAQAPPHLLLDLREVGIGTGPRGVAYLESEKRYAIADISDLTSLLVTDPSGRRFERRAIDYLPTGFVPEHFEGLAYIPEDSPIFPDHLVLSTITFVTTQETRLQVLTRAGQVVREIIPDPPLDTGWGLGLTFFAPDRLLLYDLNGGLLYVLDFDGHVVGGPIAPPPGLNFEGLMQMPDGRVIASDFFAGKLYFYDENLDRLPEFDRDYGIAPGVSRPTGIAWDESTGRFVVLHAENQTLIATVAADLRTAAPFADLSALGRPRSRGMVRLASEGLFAVAHRIPDEILLFDAAGSLVETVDLSAVGRPLALDYIPWTGEFAVRLNGDPTRIHLLDRDGTPTGVVDLTGTVAEATYFTAFDPGHPTGGRWLVGDRAADELVVVDFAGAVEARIPISSTLGSLTSADLAQITSGPDAGAFALADAENSEVIVFDLE